MSKLSTVLIDSDPLTFIFERHLNEYMFNFEFAEFGRMYVTEFIKLVVICFIDNERIEVLKENVHDAPQFVHLVVESVQDNFCELWMRIMLDIWLKEMNIIVIIVA